jgi:hypothetical protein
MSDYQEILWRLEMLRDDGEKADMYYPRNLPISIVKPKRVFDLGIKEQPRVYTLQQILNVYIETECPDDYKHLYETKEQWLLDKRRRDNFFDGKWHFKFPTDFTGVSAYKKWISVKSINLKIFNESIEKDLSVLVDCFKKDILLEDEINNVLTADKLLSRAYEEDIAFVCASFNYQDTKAQVGSLHERNLETQYVYNNNPDFEIWLLDRQGNVIQEPRVQGKIILDLYVEK